MAAELRADVLRGGLMTGDDLKHLLQFITSAFFATLRSHLLRRGGYLLAEHFFCAEIMLSGVEFHFADLEFPVGRAHRPTSQAAGQFHDIALGITSVNSQR